MMTNCASPRFKKEKLKKLKTNRNTQLIDLIYRELKASKQFVSVDAMTTLTSSRQTQVNTLKSYEV